MPGQLPGDQGFDQEMFLLAQRAALAQDIAQWSLPGQHPGIQRLDALIALDKVAPWL